MQPDYHLHVLISRYVHTYIALFSFYFPARGKGKKEKRKRKEKKKNTGKVEYFIVAAAALRLWFALLCVLSVWWKSSDACVGVTRHIYLIYRYVCS